MAQDYMDAFVTPADVAHAERVRAQLRAEREQLVKLPNGQTVTRDTLTDWWYAR